MNQKANNTKPLVSYQEALDIIRAKAKEVLIQEEIIPLKESASRVLSKKIVSKASLPFFDNSAMDGFCLISKETENATEETPAVFAIKEEILAGENFKKTLLKKEAMPIMTGAVVPKGADCVVKIEDTKVEGSSLFLNKPVPLGHNIRKKGTDFLEHQTLLNKHARLNALNTTVLSAFGVDKVSVFRKLKVALIATGNELSLKKEEHESLKEGLIYESNTQFMRSFLESLGVDVIEVITLKDNQSEFESYVTTLSSKADIIISSGAVSKGVMDFIPSSLQSLGAKTLFHGIALRPGKPNLFAKLPSSSVYFGLPGNPVSCVVGLRFLVMPFILSAYGLWNEKPLKAKLCQPIKKPSSLHFFYKAHCFQDEKGEMRVRLFDKQQSYQLSPFLEMNAFVALQEGIDSLEKEELVDVHFLNPLTL